MLIAPPAPLFIPNAPPAPDSQLNACVDFIATFAFDSTEKSFVDVIEIASPDSIVIPLSAFMLNFPAILIVQSPSLNSIVIFPFFRVHDRLPSLSVVV